MAGLYYDPSIHDIFGKVIAGIETGRRSAKTAQDLEFEKQRQGLLAEQITAAKRENARQTTFDKYMTDNASLYAPRTEEVPSADPMNPSEVNMTPVTLPPRKNMLEVAADAKLKSGDLAGYLDILKTTHSLQSKPHEIVNAFGTFLERVGKEGYLTPQIVKGAAKYMGVPADIADNMNFDPQGNSLTMQERTFTRPELDALGFGAFAEGKYNIKFALKGGKLVPTEIKTIEDKAAQPTDEMKEYELAKRQGETRSFTDWKQSLKKAGATTVQMTNKIGAESMTKLGEEMSKSLVAERKDVLGAVSSLNNIREAEALIESGIITGTGAEFLTNAGNFLSSRLGINFSEDPVANTQAYAATMGNQVGQIIKQFGSGTGLSDADREYAEKIVGGKITLNEKAIRKLIAINKKAFMNVVKTYNAKAEQAMNKPGAEALPYDLRVEIPAEKVVAKQTVNIPKIGEIRKGYKFKGGNPADQKSWERAN